MANNVIFREIGELVQKPVVEGDEKLPVSDTEYITPGQIAEKSYDDLSQVAKTGNYEDLNHLPNIPGRLSDLADDYHHRTVTDDEKRVWNNKSDFNGDYNNLTNQPDLSQFITASVNNLVNYYLKSDTYTKEEVQALVSTIQGVSFVLVDTLPSASAETMGKIYLVPSASAQAGNVKDEYITLDNGEEANPRYTWEGIGSTAIDLSGYVTTQALNTALSAYTTTADLNTLLGGKADKVSGATNGNFAGLDSNGNITDSGSKASDFATAAQGAKADSAYQKPSGGIPASDLASGVIPADVVQYTSQSLTDAQKAQARTNIGATAPEIFWAVYDTTTASEISSVLSGGGKIILVKEGNYVYHYAGTDSSYYYFTCLWSLGYDRNVRLRISNNVWSVQTASFEIVSNKTDDIASNSTSTSKYPNTKAVADYAQPKIDSTHKLDYSLIDNQPTIPTVSLNGSSTTAPSFYAPTSAGTSGYVLTSSGSGAPVWAAAPSGGGAVNDVTIDGTSIVSNGVAALTIATDNEIDAIFS